MIGVKPAGADNGGRAWLCGTTALPALADRQLGMKRCSPWPRRTHFEMINFMVAYLAAKYYSVNDPD
jgi:hypothetical protein